jgi:hypothetical protein
LNIKRITAFTAIAAVASLGFAATASADEALDFQKGAKNAPGQIDRIDADHNAYGDAGVYVNGHYKSFYAEDANGSYYWDLGDGRIYTSDGPYAGYPNAVNVESTSDLDPETVVNCDYQVTYRADFGNDAYMNEGWITNNIKCDDGTATNYLIVSKTDPRFTGEGLDAGWGSNWEAHVLTETGSGNLARPALVG